MSGPYVEQTAGPAAKVGDILDGLMDLVFEVGAGRMDASAVRSEVAALAAAAWREGEERGAAKERERIAKAIERAGFAYEDFKSSEHYRGGYLDGLGDAADLARGAS